jgi:hypothetical protein
MRTVIFLLLSLACLPVFAAKMCAFDSNNRTNRWVETVGDEHFMSDPDGSPERWLEELRKKPKEYEEMVLQALIDSDLAKDGLSRDRILAGTQRSRSAIVSLFKFRPEYFEGRNFYVVQLNGPKNNLIWFYYEVVGTVKGEGRVMLSSVARHTTGVYEYCKPEFIMDLERK